ncbi:uncharacterized protein LOC124848260 [Vigna umbellata]|uniref:uncharacterized protein LOC124838052 n=1 Tax=Vigna umbellata TaxID=87088 RepID=UPI001F5E5B12|nr:uncharacterized protein LOC124838052 [Vigna umbellata]XP_047181856.1 uncharacterized protein LOC124848260 [Vigna umbellata]
MGFHQVFPLWFSAYSCSTSRKMAPRPPPPPPQPEPSENTRMLEVVLQAMQQQNTALVQQNTVALQNLEAARVAAENARVSSENTQRQLMEVLTSSRDMERIYYAKGCPDERKLAYTQYLLTGEAGHWWSSMRMILERSETPITWELFRVKFYTEYFPNSGNKTVSEYVDRFKHLLRFNTTAVDEEWQSRKFENGLRGDIKLLVNGLRIREFPALVEMARDMEKTKKESEGP